MNNFEKTIKRIKEKSQEGIEFDNKAYECFKNVQNDINYILKCATFNLHELDMYFNMLSVELENKLFYALDVKNVPNKSFTNQYYDERLYCDGNYYKLLVREDSLLNNCHLNEYDIPALIKHEKECGKVIVFEHSYPRNNWSDDMDVCYLTFGDTRYHQKHELTDNNWHINLDNIPYFKLFLKKVIEYRANNNAKKLNEDELNKLVLETINEYKINTKEKARVKTLTKF